MVTTVAEPIPVTVSEPVSPPNGAEFRLKVSRPITKNDENYGYYEVNIDHLITEDDEPVDNLFSEKQQRLLTEPLYSTWAGPGENRPYLVAANVGVFASTRQPPLVPDVFLALDVQADTNWWTTGRSYFTWEYGKPPDVVIEIVSNTKGNENHKKMQDYQRMGVNYYVIFDPNQEIQAQPLRLYERHGSGYVEMTTSWFEPVQLGLTLWTGSYEQCDSVWLRWCDRNGQVIPTGAELVEQERSRVKELQTYKDEIQPYIDDLKKAYYTDAEQERLRTKEAQQQAEQERLRAEKLLAQLRALGVDPEL